MAIYVRVRDGMGSVAGGTGATEGDLTSFYTNFLLQAGVLYQATTDFQVTQEGTPAAGVKVAAGSAVVLNAAWAANASAARFWEVNMDADVTHLAIAANSSGSTRIDLVCIKIDTAATPDDNASNVASVVIVQGTPGAGVPATPSNHYKLAEVTLASGFSTVVNANITDRRAPAYFNLAKASLANATWFQLLDASNVLQNVLRMNSSGVMELDDTRFAHVIGSQHLNATNGIVQATADTTITAASATDITGAVTPVITPAKNGTINLKGIITTGQASGSSHVSALIYESVNGGGYAVIGGSGTIGGPHESTTVRRHSQVWVPSRALTAGNTYQYKLVALPDAAVTRTAYAYASAIEYGMFK